MFYIFIDIPLRKANRSTSHLYRYLILLCAKCVRVEDLGASRGLTLAASLILWLKTIVKSNWTALLDVGAC